MRHSLDKVNFPEIYGCYEVNEDHYWLVSRQFSNLTYKSSLPQSQHNLGYFLSL